MTTPKSFNLSQEYDEFGSQIKLWITKVVTGIIVADGVVHQDERQYLALLLQGVDRGDEALQAMQEIIQTKTPPPLEPLSVGPEMSERIFRHILKICACDHDIHPAEMSYVRKAGLALKIKETTMQRLIRDTMIEVKDYLFHEIHEHLPKSEHRWLATIILKTIYADGRLDRNELVYLNDVYTLLEGDVEQLEIVKTESRKLEMRDLPTKDIAPDIGSKILKYLMHLVLSDDDLHDQELQSVREVANLVNYDVQELEDLISSTVAHFEYW